ncbi:hypothetical protein D3C72_1256690 [compost metagenome]
MAFARAASKRATLAPNIGGCTMTTVRMPGSMVSMPNCCLPVDLSRASSRPVGLPMSLNCCGDFSWTLAGTGSARAAAASSP